MNRLELRIPPPVVMLVAGAVMWLLADWFPALAAAPYSNVGAAVMTALLGLAVSLAGILAFRRAGTTIDPRGPAQASTLVSSGIYRYSRNPMYLGVLLILLGWGVYLGNILTVLGMLAYYAYITRYQIIPEERQLETQFGADFVTYRDRVRRWL